MLLGKPISAKEEKGHEYWDIARGYGEKFFTQRNPRGIEKNLFMRDERNDAWYVRERR